jgi:Ser/Thr protein kinase RdoA (MazF antagonist)
MSHDNFLSTVAPLVRAMGLGDVTQLTPHRVTARYATLGVTTTHGSYFARLGLPQAQEVIKFEQTLLLTLTAHGLRAPRWLAHSGRARGRKPPLAMRRSAPPRALALTLYAPVPGHRVPAFWATAHHSAQVGHHLAASHRVLRQLRPVPAPQGTPVGEWLPRAIVHAQATVEASAHMAHVGRVLGRGKARSRGPQGIQLSGAAPEVAHFVNDRLVGLVDLGPLRRGPLLMDLAAALYAWGFTRDELVPARMAALLAGYSERRALSGEEREALWPLLEEHAALLALQKYVQFEMGEMPEPSIFAPIAQRYEDYRHDVRRLQALGACPAELWR